MNMPLAGKIALITGASRGIGRACALRLAADGAMIAVHYGTNKAAAEATLHAVKKAGVDGFLLGGDLRRYADIAKLYETFDSELTSRTGKNKFDILLNNAGVLGGPSTITGTSEEQFDDIFDLNVKGTFFMAQFAIPRLNDNGRILNFSSNAARNVTPAGSAYKASKTVVKAITESLAAELGPRGIAVNCIAPGPTATDMIGHRLKDEAFMKSMEQFTAMRRIGQPEDIADMVALLCGNDARWITGQSMEVTGGRFL